MVRYIKSLARPMGRIHVDFGEPVRLDRAPDPNDQLAISKIAFQVAVEATGHASDLSRRGLYCASRRLPPGADRA